ncbi:3-isopropylmalate dehydratase small subunit [Paraburkholderia acidisoli]|uniref:3-isopropylmalate dehydratase small subunit n=1 Tax=Paraburkholderia acidisoli TaxID=2571748 RepID=A0A7Z2JJ78_9BURK|nr:3-isopropylmalate dehydratase small subunit [Paraburkholderia acidisoli]QGZ65933.1 3-isopropylmalate dehydratase small subunit [Paraburkholderia acidisoli]
MAKPLTVTGVAAPLPINNLDTDQIMPKQFLLGIDKAGLARGLLYDLRFDPAGRAREQFVLNREAYRDAKILIGGSNFGCGSSREHAVWGLQQAGFEAVIAPSYGEIFYFNAANNRLLLVVLPPAQIEALVHEIEQGGSKQLAIDIEGQYVESPSGVRYAFELPARQKQMLVEGLDMVGMTLKDAAAIDAFEQRHWAANPWCRIDLPAQQAHWAALSEPAMPQP